MTTYRQDKTFSTGKAYTRDLRWCSLHGEPAWSYGDGSVACWWETLTETATEDHVLVDIDQAEDLTAVES